ncbi:MAG: hypothetical protein GC159_16250 [Phycisphaera sp.]|nr:hypothetical protein [Phycisphaera sp.]
MNTKRKQDMPTAARFLRSAHLEMDFRDAEALGGYVLTSGASRVLSRVLPTENGKPHGNAWTITGPYGTGKSSFAVFASQLLAASAHPGQQRARKLLKEGSPQLFDRLAKAKLNKPGLIPVVVTGTREPISLAILRGLHCALAGVRRRGAAALRKKIDAAIDAPMSDGDLLTLIDSAYQVLSSNGGDASGLVLIVDELGKLLEYAGEHPARSDVYVLQQIAEYAVRAPYDFLFLTILHQDFAGYAARLSTTDRAEWEKVQGRFEDVAFEESADDMFRLVGRATSGDTGAHDASSRNSKTLSKLTNNVWSAGVAPAGITKSEFQAVINDSLPLHPLVTTVLGHLFRRLAQNERSVFSFLISNEPNSLREFVSSDHADDFYTLDRFYDYLVSSIGDGLMVGSKGKRWAEIATAIDRLSKADADVLRVLKIIGLLNVLDEWRGVSATEPFIEVAAAPSLSRSRIGAAIEVLRKQSIIVHRRFNNSFAIWEGSDVDVDERIRSGRDRLEGTASVAQLLAQHHTPRALIAQRHAFETGTLRYLSCEYQSVESAEGRLQVVAESSDGSILIVLPENAEETTHAEALAQSAKAKGRSDVLIGIPVEVQSLRNVVVELAALHWVVKNTDELEGDRVARRELRARIADVLHQLDEHIDEIFGASGAPLCRWFYEGQPLELSNRRSLREHLSKMCDKNFPQCPTVRNELINRKQLSSSAAAARRNLMEQMVTASNEETVGISGYPPEMSVYLSMLKEGRIHRRISGEWCFRSPPKSDPLHLGNAWQVIEHAFAESEKTPLRLSDIYDRLSMPPIGLRDGPVPILVWAALIAHESDVALYEEGGFVPELSGAVVERLLKAPETFTVRRWRVTGLRAKVFQQLASMLGSDKVFDDIGRRDVLDVVRPILRFYRELPNYAQHTDQVGKHAQAIRQAIEGAKEPDVLLFEELPKACGVKSFQPDSKPAQRQVKEFLDALREAIMELQRSYDLLLEQLAEAIGAAFGISGGVSQVRTELADRAEIVAPWVADRDLSNFVSRVCEADLDDRDWVATVAALLAEKLPERWRDTDRAKFEISLTQVARLFGHVLTLAHAAGTKGKKTTGLALRLGVTAADAPEQETVVELPKKALADVERLEKLIGEQIKKPKSKRDRDIILAALARLSQRLMSEDR